MGSIPRCLFFRGLRYVLVAMSAIVAHTQKMMTDGSRCCASISMAAMMPAVANQASQSARKSRLRVMVSTVMSTSPRKSRNVETESSMVV